MTYQGAAVEHHRSTKALLPSAAGRSQTRPAHRRPRHQRPSGAPPRPRSADPSRPLDPLTVPVAPPGQTPLRCFQLPRATECRSPNTELDRCSGASKHRVSDQLTQQKLSVGKPLLANEMQVAIECAQRLTGGRRRFRAPGQTHTQNCVIRHTNVLAASQPHRPRYSDRRAPTRRNPNFEEHRTSRCNAPSSSETHGRVEKHRFAGETE